MYGVSVFDLTETLMVVGCPFTLYGTLLFPVCY